MKLTPKGVATRSRIVATAADLVLARGIGGTSLDDIRAGTATSKSQLFHYFPGGKAELVGAIASFQGERVLDAQRPFLDSLDSWEAWESWRRAVVDHYGSQQHWGCPISALAREVLGNDPERAGELAASWIGGGATSRLASRACDPPAPPAGHESGETCAVHLRGTAGRPSADPDHAVARPARGRVGRRSHVPCAPLRP